MGSGLVSRNGKMHVLAEKKRVLSISQDIVLRDDYVSYMRTSSSTTYVGFRRQRTKPKYFRKLRKGRELKCCVLNVFFSTVKIVFQNTSRVLQRRVLWLYRGRDNSKYRFRQCCVLK